jgi:hypothetical protein
MFLTQKSYDIEDFLSALHFIAPKGTSVAYFISPSNDIQLPQNSGFQKQQLLDIPEDESITYVRQQPVQKQDQAMTPADYSVFDPRELGRRIPTPNILPPVTEPESLDSPFVKVLSESLALGTDVKLLEDYKMFPKNTLFHCTLLKEKKASPHDELFRDIYKLNEISHDKIAKRQEAGDKGKTAAQAQNKTQANAKRNLTNKRKKAGRDRVQEGASFMPMMAMAARNKSLFAPPKMMPLTTSADGKILEYPNEKEIKRRIEELDDGENSLGDILDVLKLEWPKEPRPMLEQFLFDYKNS